MNNINNNDNKKIIIIITSQGNSSVGRLRCLFLVKRFTVRISPLALFVNALYICGSQRRSDKIILGVP